MINLIRIALIFILLLPFGTKAQNGVTYQIKGDFIHANIDLKQPPGLIDSIVKTFGFDSLRTIENQTSTRGWQYKDQTVTNLHLVLNKKSNTKELPNAYTINDGKPLDSYNQPKAPVYGVNSFKKQSVYTNGDNIVFTLNDYSKANQVYLSGSFNGWSTLETPMKKTDGGWEISLPLHTGKHLYKFIVDGQWMYDLENKNRENDGNNGYNSVYYVTNYTFILNGFSYAKRVVVAGSFNDWNPLKMEYDTKTNGWCCSLFLREGTHAYKYRVDGDWILDPKNQVVRPDGMGNENNFMSVGDTLYFELKGHFDAQKVSVAGEFNAWNFDELAMYRGLYGWSLPYVLPAGNFEYKFRLDGQYLLDPNNNVTTGEGDYINNVLSVKPNHTFMLKGFTEAKEVLLSGSFNNWNANGYTMQRVGDTWQISIYLAPGKQLYKFVVDGNWIIDPENKLWEKNQFDGKNSILWMEP